MLLLDVAYNQEYSNSPVVSGDLRSCVLDPPLSSSSLSVTDMLVISEIWSLCRRVHHERARLDDQESVSDFPTYGLLDAHRTQHHATEECETLLAGPDKVEHELEDDC
jgi:hypothetical protein